MNIRKYLFWVALLLQFLLCFSLSSQSLASAKLGDEASKQLVNYTSLAERYKSQGDEVQEANYYNKIAYLYWENQSSKEAIEFFNKSLKINEKVGNENALQTIYTNIGTIYYDVAIYDKSLLYYSKSLDINRENRKKRNICENLINIALASNELRKSDEALKALEEANSLAAELNDLRLIKTCLGMLYESYNNIGETEKASHYFEQYRALEGKLHKDQVTALQKKTQEVAKEKQATEQKLQKTSDNLKEVSEIAEVRQKEIVNLNKQRQLEEQERELQERERLAKEKEQKSKQRVRFVIILAIIGILIIILLVIYINNKRNKKVNALLAQQNKEISKQKDIIEVVNKNITHSINYARRIQKALLPPATSLNDLVDESFIFFKPRDIVSGDFYWFSETKLKSVISKSSSSNLKEHYQKYTKDVDDGIIISAIDCTGHGVPGAFMSMIGFNLIHEIISYGVIEPEKILKLLNIGVRNQLKQKETDNRDGMDMAICLINNKKNKLEYAGAKNPLIYIKNDKVHQIKGDFLPIGGFFKDDDERDYTKHTIDIDEPTMFYLFSDGFSDQIGGEQGRKYLSKYFRELLLEISKMPVKKQSDALEKKLKEWMGEKYNQIDDILVIGFKLYPNK